MFNMSQQAAVAGTPVTDKAPLEFSAIVAGKPVHLVQVILDNRPFPPAERGTTFCLDVHESKNAMSAAVEYVKQTRAVKPGSKLRFTPSIFALVNTSVLSAEERSIVNSELIPAGASIFEYPRACKSFREAMSALFEEFKETHRAHAEDDYRPSSIFELVGMAVGTLVGKVVSVPVHRSERAVSEPVVSNRVVSERASSVITKASAAE